MAGFTVWPLILATAGLIAVSDGHCDSIGGCATAQAASAPSLLATKATSSQITALSEIPVDMTEGILDSNDSNVSNGSAVNQTDKQTLEDIISKNMKHDFDQANSMPDLENSTDAQGRHGFGSLGKNLEFMMLKLAQLETIVELQQVEIKELQDFKRSHMVAEHNASAATPSALEVKAQEEAKKKEAQEVLKRVLHKHNHQRDKKEFYGPKTPKESKEPKLEASKPKPKDEKHELLQRQIKSNKEKQETEATTLDESVSSKIFTSGTGMIGKALSDAYDAAEDQVAFVSNTVIDSVEMAVDILIRGFSDFEGDCDFEKPSMRIDGSGFSVNWGKQKCWLRLMGQTCNLFDINLGTIDLDWPEPLKTVAGFEIQPIKSVFNMGKELVNCGLEGSPLDVMKCFGYKLIETIPPFNFLNRLGDMLSEFIEVFAKVAAIVVKQVLDDHQSLVQQAAMSKFPAAGAAPVVHHASKSLTIKTHSQHPSGSTFGSKSKLQRIEGMSAMEENASSSGDDDAQGSGAINFAIHDQEGNYATKLITQFNGKEIDTSSCLAFAPKNKHGSNGQATEGDWQVNSNDDFIQLEPWAVPCDNSWMKDNWNKWQGYSFYTWEQSIEKCVTVSYSLAMQPVLAFVGGLEFELMPAPLAQLDTVVCWPDKQPGGVDLSVLRTEISSGGVLLFSRTLRLTKRFGSSTDFVDGNYFGAHETWRNPVGIATGTHSVEDDRTLEPMSRTASLLQNETKKMGGPQKQGGKASLDWEETDLYLASIDYGKHLDINKTSELSAHAAKKRLGRMGRKGPMGISALQSGTDYFKLFSFKNPGMVNFNIEGLLEDNNLDLEMKINFGPFESPTKRIPLVNIVDQFSMVLTAMPFVSLSSKAKALTALRGFTKDDVKTVVPEVPMIAPGSMIALHCTKHNRFLSMNDLDMAGSGHRDVDKLPDDWSYERFTVVDAGNGQIALHNAKWNRFIRMETDQGLGRSAAKAASDLPHNWSWERFTVVSAGNGEVALHNSLHNSFISMKADGTAIASPEKGAEDLPDNWSYERFRIVQVKPYLTPGSVIALHNNAKNRFLLMNDHEDMDRSTEKNVDDLPSNWDWERFTVVDAGNGQVALHSAKWNRFVSINGGDACASPPMAANELPSNWALERFAVVPAVNGQIALHNPHHNRFLRMTSEGVDASNGDAGDLPSGWSLERFQIVVTSPFSTDDSTWSFS